MDDENDDFFNCLGFVLNLLDGVHEERNLFLYLMDKKRFYLKSLQRATTFEDQLKKIEAEIRFMTMKARLEERQRLRAEREQSFRETYFDTRTTEFEEK